MQVKTNHDKDHLAKILGKDHVCRRNTTHGENHLAKKLRKDYAWEDYLIRRLREDHVYVRKIVHEDHFARKHKEDRAC